MKRIFLLTAAMLIGSGPVFAGDLKVMVPVDEFKQLKSRLDALEKENSRLKQVGAADEVKAVSPVSGELQSRLQAVENENGRLLQELNAIKSQERPVQVDTGMQARLDAIEKENRQLKEARANQSEKSPAVEDSGLVAKLTAAESENSKLQNEVKALRDGGFAAVFAENKTSARELYFLQRKKGLSHSYKF